MRNPAEGCFRAGNGAVVDSLAALAGILGEPSSSFFIAANDPHSDVMVIGKAAVPAVGSHLD